LGTDYGDAQSRVAETPVTQTVVGVGEPTTNLVDPSKSKEVLDWLRDRIDDTDIAMAPEARALVEEVHFDGLPVEPVGPEELTAPSQREERSLGTLPAEVIGSPGFSIPIVRPTVSPVITNQSAPSSEQKGVVTVQEEPDISDAVIRANEAALEHWGELAQEPASDPISKK
jgi:hypothetical protein